jgi:25S rRNA (uracil2634-N3)-methyltransferase
LNTFLPKNQANKKSGDFSFARSLAKQYKCRKLLATSYDSRETLFEKYPQAEQNIQDILHSNPKPKPQSEDSDSPKQGSNSPKVLFSVDARKLGGQGGGGKEIKNGFPRREARVPAWKAQQQSSPKAPGGPWDVICFNFPHVGGISTDVNRQVRFNQELLVAFFKACIPLLSAAPEPVDSDDEWEDEDEDEDEAEDEDEEDVQTSGKAVRTGPGQILVSLFEAEPYTLWNIKDLARHAGLQVVTSFRFPWSSYEGYSHARTLGEVEGKNGGRGGWRGEDREARMYVFEVKKETQGKKKKRARDDSSDSE